jgi:hypothetical protein
MRWGKHFLYVPLGGRDLLTLLPSAIPEPRIYPRGIWLTALPADAQISRRRNRNRHSDIELDIANTSGLAMYVHKRQGGSGMDGRTGDVLLG